MRTAGSDRDKGGFLAGSPPLRRKWITGIGAALFHAFHVSLVYMGPTAMIYSQQSSLKLSTFAAALPVNVYKLSLLVFLPTVSVGLHFGSPRSVILMSSCGAALLAFIYPFSGHLWTLILIELLYALSFAYCGVAVLFKLVIEHFPQQPGLAATVVLSGWSLAGTLTPAAYTMDIQRNGWRATSFHMAVLFCVVALPVVFFLLKPPPSDAEDAANGADSASDTTMEEGTGDDELHSQTKLLPTSNQKPQKQKPRSSGIGQGLLATVKSQPFWPLAALYFMLAFHTGMVYEHYIVYLEDELGLPLPLAGRMLSMLHAVGLLTKTFTGALGDRFTHLFTLLIGSALCLISPGILFGLHASEISSLAFSALFGVGYATVFTSIYAAVPLSFGTDDVASVQSLLLCFLYTGSFVGSMLAGALRDVYGTYQGMFGLMMLVAALQLATVLRLAKVSPRLRVSARAQK